MKKTFFKLVTLVTICATSTVFAQVGVGVPAGDIHPSAELEVKSSTKGFLPPRMTKAQRLAMIVQGSTTYPAAGLLVFQTDGDANEPTGLYFFDGTAWRNGAGVAGAIGPKGDKGEKGDTGAQGVQGTQGLNTLAKTTTEAAGANCITGGVKIEYGFDANNSGTLDDAEINPALTKYVCNGIQGPIGEKGLQGVQGEVGPKGDQGGVTSKIYTIGHWPELGGYVFRISEDGTHGLVAETKDQAASSSWYSAQDAISNPVNHSTNGKKFMDWRLPTPYELNEMYVQKGAIGGFSMAAYWSSSEKDANDAWPFLFYKGFAYYFSKSDTYFVRAVRAF